MSVRRKPVGSDAHMSSQHQLTPTASHSILANPNPSNRITTSSANARAPGDIRIAAAGAHRLLAALPADELRRLQSRLEPVHLIKDRVLHEADDATKYAFFPLGGMVSLQAMAPQGASVEVATVGNEGVVGLSIVFGPNRPPFEAIVQIEAPALRITAEALLIEFRRCATLQELLLRYAHVLLAQTSQSVVCHRFHTAAQRLSRWLLTARDRGHADTIELTQEQIAHVLGVPRTRISKAAVELQAADMIRCRHGRITILDPSGLEAAACECYGIVRDAVGQT